MAILARQRITIGVGVGYGPGSLVTPVADALRAAAGRARLTLREVLRAENGRYWSYLCKDPACCPAEGVRYDSVAHPAAAALATAGLAAYPDRESLARTLSPVKGTDAESMSAATERALARVAVLIGEQRKSDRAGTCCGSSWKTDAARSLRRSARTAPRRPTGRRRPDRLAQRGAHRSARARRCVGPDEIRTTARRTGGCGPTSSAGRVSAMSRHQHRCWRSPPGRPARARWRTSPSSAPWTRIGLLDGAFAPAICSDAGVPPSEARLPMTPEEVAESYARAEQPS